MPRWSARARVAWLPALRRAALVVLVLAASSCSKKKIVVGADGLEGVPSSSQLVVWKDTPVRVYYFADTTLEDDDPEDPSKDVFLGMEETDYAYGAGGVAGMIFDFTAADQFQVFRSENARFLPLKDFNLQPAKRYPLSQTATYQFADRSPGPVDLRDYVARGLVAGTTTQQSPKTNLAHASQPEVESDVHFTAPAGVAPDFRVPPDSLLVMEWDPVPNAAGYWVQVNQRNDLARNFRLSTRVSPIYVARILDYFLAYFPAGVTQYRIGDPVPAGARIVSRRTLFNGQSYLVRIAAVNDRGEFIGRTGAGRRGPGGGPWQARDLLYFNLEVRSESDSAKVYALREMGAVLVHTKGAAATPGPTGPARMSQLRTDLSDPKVVDAGALGKAPAKRSR